MGDYSVRAILSAIDKGFSSTMKSAVGYTNNLKSTLASGFGFGILSGAGQAAFSAIGNSAMGLAKETIGTSDAMQKLRQAMKFSGSTSKEIERIAGSTGTLKTYADKTVFSLEDVMSTFGALSANGIKDADKMTEAVGNAVAVFGGGAQEFSSVGLAYSQAMASGALHAQDWNQILNASPQLAGGLRKELTRLNPALGKDFKGAMEKGAISADLLGEAMNNIGMTDLAKEAATSVTTFEGAMGNLQATATSGMLSLYDTFAKTSVVDAINGMNAKLGAGFDWLSTNIPALITKVKPYWNEFTKQFNTAKDAVGDAASAIGKDLGSLIRAFDENNGPEKFREALSTASDAIVKFSGFCEEHSDTIAKLISLLPKLYVGYKGFQIVKAVVPFVATFTGAIGGLAKMGLSGIAKKLFGLSKSQKEVGKASVENSQQIVSSAKAFAFMGLAVMTIAIGFGILAGSAIALANAGGLAIGVMVGLAAGLAGMMVGMAFILKMLAPMATQLMPAATAMLALGGAVLLVSAGFAVMAGTAIALSNAGGVAIGVFFGMIVAFAGLLAVAALLAPVLTAGAVGFIAFGTAVLMVGVGALLAASALAIVASVLPAVVQYGLQGAVGIAALGAAMIVFGAGALVAGAGCVVLGAGLLMLGAGTLVAGAGIAVLAAAVLVLGTGALVLGVGLTLAASSLMMMGTALPMAASGTMACVAGMTALLAVSAGLGAALLLAGAGAIVAGTGMAVFGGAMVIGAGGTLIMAGALKMVQSSMKSISSSAKTTSSSLKTMRSSIKIVESGLDALGSKAKSAMNKLISSFNSAANKAQSAGHKVGTGFTNSMKRGLASSPRVARACVSVTTSALRSGHGRAYSAGAYISQGFASGMRSQLGAIRSAAAQMAAAADKAIRAKAKIHSPSKVSFKDGSYYGEGWVNGILSRMKDTKDAVEKLVSIPTRAMMDGPEFAFSGGYGNMSLSEEYVYGYSGKYTIVVPVDIDGREVAHATADYTQEELNKRQTRSRRKRGIR